MKKFFVSIFIIIFMLLVILGCVYMYQHFTKKEEIKQPEIEHQAIFTLESYPKVDASLATQPLTNAFIKNFTGQDVDVTKLDYTNTHPGYVRLINDEADLIVVTEPSEEELALAKEKGVELEVIPVVREGFVFYVNEKNPVNNLTLEQIQKIYTGEITNWSQVGGNNEEIRAFQRNVNSGSQTGMLSLVMKGLTMKDSLKEDRIGTMREIINIVSDYDNGSNSIGYSYYYYATTIYDDIDKQVADRIKFIAVNGIEPNNVTIQNQTYPINTAYYIVINKNQPQDGNVRKLVNAMLSDRGQNVAKEAGDVPVK